MDHGWSIKQLHRLNVLSATYQQASNADRGLRIAESTEGNPQSQIPNPQSIDPRNRLLWKMNRRRLDFEATRDTLLFVSGKLNRQIGGRRCASRWRTARIAARCTAISIA